MNKPESPCETDEEYNLYECWRKGVHDQLGCLIFARNNTNERECETEEELDIYIKWFLKGLNNHKESTLEEVMIPHIFSNTRNQWLNTLHLAGLSDALSL